ncbi:hypothetical protein N8H41_08885 [Pseudomonas vlassakiae]|uniref:hypothetical protein n=1 Tax=Pseudomonas TaxID=286 RepID=UPI0006D3D8C7|nr:MULTISPECIES: hypothetical protein [Pseudomonas]MBS3187095.1 hypothetical protein [Pseudomonas sp. PCH44]MCU0124091.1 hypothetical protein [Pseudomonas vlassakiae]
MNADLFEYWLMDMNDAIDRFLHSFPTGDREQFDYSIASLDYLEAWLLRRYENFDALKPKDQAAIIDGAARYVGQVFRRHLGGKWFMNDQDKQDMFCGRPQLVEMKGQFAQISPLSMVTAAVDRRTGVYIGRILNSLKTKAGE